MMEIRGNGVSLRCHVGKAEWYSAVIIDVPASENIMKQKVEAENEKVIETLMANGATDIQLARSQISP